MDHVSKEVRKHIMSSVKTKNTSAEMMLRSMVHRMGYRYVLHKKDLPGKPDLVFPSRRKVIFVHGCFWHGHNCRYGKLPKTRKAYWASKIEGNISRDRMQQRMLRRNGWSILVVWQCQLKKADTLAKKIRKFFHDE